ncbi:MAG: hypothetical protein U0353_02410 [Sandaracinus sp.]
MNYARSITRRACVATILALGLEACGGGDGADAGADARVSPDVGVADDTGALDDAARRASVWSCLPLAQFPTPTDRSQGFTLSLTELDGFTPSGPSVGTRVEACALGDEACTHVIAEDTSNADGEVSLVVPTPGVPWQGFLRFTSATSLPNQLFLLPPTWGDFAWWGGPWAVIDHDDLVALAGSETLDDTKGHVVVLTADCCYVESTRAAPPECRGSDTNELEVTVDGVPSENTGMDDYALFINLEPGPALVEARLRTTHELVGQEEIFIVAGGLSQTVIGPTPARPAGMACVGSVTWSDAPAATLDATFQSFQNPATPIGDGMPFEGLVVDVCGAGTDCSAPLDTGTTDAAGSVTLTLPTPGFGFTGYLRSTAADHLPTRMIFYPPIATAESRWLASTHHKWVLSGDDLEQMVTGYTYSPTLATVIATTTDCAGAFSEAVDVTLDGAPAANDSGDSLWLDVTPGPVHLVAHLRSTGEILARIDAQAVAGEITAVHFGPMPTTP